MKLARVLGRTTIALACLLLVLFSIGYGRTDGHLVASAMASPVPVPKQEQAQEQPRALELPNTAVYE
jgi:hypothetical protein